jgi:hypothetical protein
MRKIAQVARLAPFFAALALAGCRNVSGNDDGANDGGAPDAGADEDTGEETCADSERAWTRVLPIAGATADLYDACARPDGSVLAVGKAGAWELVAPNDAISAGEVSGLTYLAGVWCGPDGQAIAVGASSGAASPIWRYDGSAWSQMDASPTWALAAIDGAAEDALYAVGSDGLVVAFDGTTWAEVETVVPYYVDLYGVWAAAADDVHVMGCYPNANKSRAQFFCSPDAFRYHGGVWTETLLDTSSDVGLTGLWGRAADDVWMVGYHAFQSDTGAAYRFDGGGWSAVPMAGAPPLYDLAGDATHLVSATQPRGNYDTGVASFLEFADGAWTAQGLTGWRGRGIGKLVWSDDGPKVAVGEGGAILRYADGAWRPLNGPTNLALNDVWGAADGWVYAVGNDALVLRGRGRSWEILPVPEDVPPELPLRSVFGFAPDFVLVGGFLRWDGAAWTELPDLPVTAYEVWGTSADDFFAMDATGDVARRKNGAWSLSFESPDELGYPSYLFTDMAGIGSDIYVVGETSLYQTEGIALHFDGSGWWDLAAPAGATVAAIGGASADDVHAFDILDTDGAGAFIRYDGAAWTEILALDHRWVSDIFALAPSDVYAVSTRTPIISPTSTFEVFDSGRLFRFDGAAWTELSPSFGDAPAAIWGTSDANLYVVGNDGSIYHTACP